MRAYLSSLALPPASLDDNTYIIFLRFIARDFFNFIFRGAMLILLAPPGAPTSPGAPIWGGSAGPRAARRNTLRQRR
jgi:hypothetical protein